VGDLFALGRFLFVSAKPCDRLPQNSVEETIRAHISCYDLEAWSNKAHKKSEHQFS